MKLRIARHTDRIHEVVAFYRDRVGLREVGKFDGHDGYDGVFLEVPVVTANPYWRKNARAYEDPDGFLVLLALAA